MMKTFEVRMPFCGYAVQTVEAENEDDAKNKFLEEFTELKNTDHYEWDFHETIVQGNVFYGAQNSVEVELIDSDEDDD